MTTNTKIYAGSSHPELANDISRASHIPLGEITLSRFDNRESRVCIKDAPAQTAVIVQSLSIPVDHHLIEMLLIIDALKRLGTREIILVIPWLGYSKQDKVFRPGEPLSVKVIANCIQTLPINEIITMDLHNPAIGGFFDIPIHNCPAQSLILEYCNSHLPTKSLIVVAPDAGAIKNSTQVAGKLDVPIAYLNKSRNLESGEVVITDSSRPVDGLDVLIVDDLIATGSTIISAARFLKSRGAKSVTVAVTHHLQIKGIQEKIDASDISQCIITDSVQTPQQLSPKITVLPCAGLLAQTLLPMIK
ncbi:hypothetical protein A3B57_03245 [Microgenomates group bacterium RIFCSPLOWO2_01_FULL_47_10]|nr:MAG: hypothetical protein A3B57_03245 [Microgenomates group bacterium RIFCSPLOWO2_01_FULL_47_10]